MMPSSVRLSTQIPMTHTAVLLSSPVSTVTGHFQSCQDLLKIIGKKIHTFIVQVINLRQQNLRRFSVFRNRKRQCFHKLF